MSDDLNGLDALREGARRGLELAMKAGATGARVWTSRSRSTSCELRDSQVEKVEEQGSRSLSLEIFSDGRYFTHSTNDLRPDRLPAFVDEAVALTRVLEPDPDRRLPDSALYREPIALEALDLYDSSLASIDFDQRIQICREMNARLLTHTRRISTSSGLSDGSYASYGVSSNGFEGESAGSWISPWASLTLRDEGDRRPESYAGASAKHREDLPSLTWIGDEAVRLADSRLGAKKGPTMTATMVVDPRATARIIYPLLGPASGSAVQQGRSFWAERLGKPAVSKRLTIVDDPHIPRGMSSKRFDSEGIAARPRTILGDGALQSFFLSSYYARRLGMAPTSGSWSNIVVEPGEGDLASIVAGVSRGIYVDSWLGGNSDATSGEFSFGIRGRLIEGGKLGAPVGEMNVSGNILDLFSRVAAIGTDPWLYGGGIRCPTLAFDKVSFSGA